MTMAFNSTAMWTIKLHIASVHSTYLVGLSPECNDGSMFYSKKEQCHMSVFQIKRYYVTDPAIISSITVAVIQPAGYIISKS